MLNFRIMAPLLLIKNTNRPNNGMTAFLCDPDHVHAYKILFPLIMGAQHEFCFDNPSEFCMKWLNLYVFKMNSVLILLFIIINLTRTAFRKIHLIDEATVKHFVEN